MFFRKKRRDEDDAAEATGDAAAPAQDAATLEGTMPELSEGPQPESGVPAGAAAGALTTTDDADAVRLFPGFEHEEFEVGFRAGAGAPSLVLRWKDGGEWFRLPAMFNRAALASMDERDSAGDLTRLMRSFGYDVA